jgi:hypothetical protein
MQSAQGGDKPLVMAEGLRRSFDNQGRLARGPQRTTVTLPQQLERAMMVFIVTMNIAVSFLNAYVCGRSWEESKAVGGILRLVVWVTAIQSALGFSSVNLLFLIYIAHDYVPRYFTEAYFKGALNLWYLTIIPHDWGGPCNHR